MFLSNNPSSGDINSSNLSCSLIAYIANNMDPDQTAPGTVQSGFILFASMLKIVCCALEYNYAADVGPISWKENGKIRVLLEQVLLTPNVVFKNFNPFSTSHDFYPLLSHLLMFIGSLYLQTVWTQIRLLLCCLLP